VQTQHAYAAHTPVVQHVATPVGVSYSAPGYGYGRPAVALAQPLAQQVAYAGPAVAVGQQVAYARPAVALSQHVAYSRPAVALAQPVAQQVAYARPTTYGYGIGQPAVSGYAVSQPGYAVARPNIEGTINTPRGTIAYSGVGTSGAYNPPVQQVASRYIGGSAVSFTQCYKTLQISFSIFLIKNLFYSDRLLLLSITLTAFKELLV